MGASKPDVAEPGLEAIHQTTTGYFRAMGKRLLALRRSREMTQVELARILGMSQQSVLSMEQGDRRVRIDLIPVLARAFGVTADELLGLKPMPPLKESPIPERLLRHLEILKTLSEGDRRFILKLAETIEATKLNRPGLHIRPLAMEPGRNGSCRDCPDVRRVTR